VTLWAALYLVTRSLDPTGDGKTKWAGGALEPASDPWSLTDNRIDLPGKATHDVPGAQVQPVLCQNPRVA
jgi:hypothetical protein